jgi:glycosyltransferase involved in cell wall biosynthesis
MILDHYDTDAWVEALRKLAADAELRKMFGQAGVKRAQDFTWGRVAARRRQQLLECALPRRET